MRKLFYHNNGGFTLFPFVVTIMSPGTGTAFQVWQYGRDNHHAYDRLIEDIGKTLEGKEEGDTFRFKGNTFKLPASTMIKEGVLDKMDPLDAFST